MRSRTTFPASLPLAPIVNALVAAAIVASALVAPAFADTFTASYAGPTLDRWNYPFNSTPGTRPIASTFGNEPGSPLFDNRDGQFVVGFDTGADIPTGLGASAYGIVSCTVTLTFANNFVAAYDPTVDPFTAFLPESDPAYIADADPGQPIELFGAGFRNGLTRATWTETTPFAPAGALDPSIRSTFAAGAGRKGALVDVSNSVRERWTPVPFAVGVVDGLEPGDLIGEGTVMRFDLDVANAAVAAYLRESLDAGRVLLTATSLTKVVQQAGDFPLFYCRENALVEVLGFGGATLDLVVETNACAPADLDCSGTVNAADLAILLGEWGTAGGADLNGDGTVEAQDLAILLGAWG